jgi:hypothetical protein
MTKLFKVRVPQSVTYTEWSVYEVEAEDEDQAIHKVKNEMHGSYPYYEDDTDYYYEDSQDKTIEVEEITA